jgi:hypothetical protein
MLCTTINCTGATSQATYLGVSAGDSVVLNNSVGSLTIPHSDLHPSVSSTGSRSVDVYHTKEVSSKRLSYAHTQSMDTIHEERFSPQTRVGDFTSTFKSIEISSLIVDSLSQYAGIKCADDIIREVEGLVALYINICDCSSLKGIVTALLLYTRDKFDKSMSSTIMSYISNLFALESQDGKELDPTTDVPDLGLAPTDVPIDEEPGLTGVSIDQSTSAPSWLTFLKKLRTNWNFCRTSGMFPNFSKILGILVVSGLARVADLTFSVGKFRLIEPDIRTLTASAPDLMTSACDIVLFFTERCHHCWRDKSFSPLFSASLENAELEVQYATLCNNWSLYRNGNLMKIAEVDEHVFHSDLLSMSDRLKTMLSSLKGIDKKLVEDKFKNITQIIGQFTIIKVNSGFKPSPFSVEYYGLSEVGKSTVSEQISHYLFTTAGLPVDEIRKYTHVSGKKHWDGARSDMLELKLDDHANTKATFVESSPCDVIIKVCNNVPYSPPMADLTEKGKVWVEPKLVSLTTNVEDLDARIYSNNPYSVQRRMNYVIEVRVRPEFVRHNNGVAMGLDSAKAIASHTVDGVYAPPTYHDVWLLTLKIATPAALPGVSGSYTIVKHGDKELRDISLIEACNFLSCKFHEHGDRQTKLTESQHNKIKETVCGVDGCTQVKGYCMKHIPTQLGTEYIPRIPEFICKIKRNSIDPAIRSVVNDKLERARAFYARYSWAPDFPAYLWSSDMFQYFMLYIYREKILLTYRRYSWLNVWLTLCSLTFMFGYTESWFVRWIYTFIIVLSSLIAQWYLIDLIKRGMYQELRTKLTLTEVQRHWSKSIVATACTATVLGACYFFAKTYIKWREFQTHGSLEPKTKEDVDSRDGETNMWASVVRRNLPVTDYSKRMSAEQLGNVVQKALVYGSIHVDGETGMVNGLMLSSNVMLIPDHYFTTFGDSLPCTFRKKNPDASGGKFAARLEKPSSYLIPNSDMRLCYVPNGGSFKNLCNYFPTGEMPSVPFLSYWRSKKGEIICGKGLTVPGVVTTCRSFTGGTYKNFTLNTFEGMCGATLVSDTNGSIILGVHLGGTGGTPRGCYGSVTQAQLQTGFNALREIEGVLLSGEAGVFHSTVMGVQVQTDGKLHVKSPLNYMQVDSQVEYFGSCPGRSVTKTDVKVTPISEHIMDVCGNPNIFHGPKLNPEWYGWQTCLSNLSIPAHPYEHSLLDLAVRDYKEPLNVIFKTELWNKATPLPDHENLCGVPGKKFMDAIKLDTSIGFPLTGPKRDYIIELEPTPEKPNNRILQDDIMLEIVRIEDCYRRGERGYPIAKACKKDEILAKEKCRIFYGNALSLTYLVRKYYLPIMRVLQMNPLVSECAVGINSHGPEWDAFYHHATRFGVDRLFGGDYGKYDQKLPAQLILASLRILIDFAKQCDYTSADIGVMEAMTGDIVFAYIAFNGDLIGLTEGTHISGNSLTVMINGICGSLNLRCFFYTEYPTDDFSTRLVFRDCVAAMTYGDDNIGSVKSGIDKFTIKGCSKFLDKYGQVYTMPDKESELLDFLPAEDFEFLKRFSVYHESLGQDVGALLDQSIYKSLHCFMRGKNVSESEDEASAQNIDGALREWFNHGETKYEAQRVLMKEVAQRAGITHMCRTLHADYNEYVQAWKQRYLKQHDD